MANEMLTGLLNQTSGGNWWQGSGAPTSGYGSLTPTPPSPQQAAPEAPAAPADPTGQPAPSSVVAQPTGQSTPAPYANQGYIGMLQQQLVAAQNNLRMAQQNVTKDISTGQPKPSYNDNAKISMAQHEVLRLQGELQQAMLKKQQAGY